MGLYEINRERHFEWLENQRRFHENKKIKEDRSLGRTPKSFDAVSRGTTVYVRYKEVAGVSTYSYATKVVFN